MRDGAAAQTLIGTEAALYPVVVEPAPLAARHDLVGVGAHQVNDVGVGACGQRSGSNW
jgi:hypothetical protein